MSRFYFLCLLFLFALPANAQTYTTDFTSGLDGWIAGFADYPVGQETFYELVSAYTPLPAPLNQSKYALMITGNNHSDDLFMFIKKQLSGLLPNTAYKVRFEVEFASNAPTDGYGVGGDPGTSVYVKAGAVTTEPDRTIDALNHYRMNIDKGEQARPGSDMMNIGHVGVGPGVYEYTLISRDSYGQTFTITTDANGKVWAIIGTDSGFEATTTLYYNKIVLTFYDPVPVELASFSASIEPDGILLRWSTVSETNNFGFEIERKSSGDWATIGFVPGSGTSALPNEYRFTDPGSPAHSPGASTVLYRLKQMDYDGSYQYSPTVDVALGSVPVAPGIARVWPNPVVGTLNATLRLPEAATVTVSLYNAAGQRVLTLLDARMLSAGTHELSANIIAVPAGMYLLRVVANGAVTARIVAIHR